MSIAKVLVPLSTESKSPNFDIPPTEFVRGTYLQALMSENLFPSFVTVHMSEEMISQAVSEASGLLLCGGADITPALYGQESHPLTKADSPLRDRLEIDLVRRFEELKMPTLGICRGCQVIPVALGGTLNQHVPDIAPDEQHGLCA
jgi:putative glutamine amidotransferase